MLVNYSPYYPANTSPHGYFKEFLKLSIGLCRRDDAPPAITEDMFTGRAQVSVSAFLSSRWVTFWHPTLPAMMKDLIPCGMDGMGEWNEPWMDAAFNQSCRESMREALIKDNMSIEVYGKAVMKASKAFIVSWETALQPAAVPLRGQLTGAESSELLSTHFMSASTFTLINARIQRWATALVQACAVHPTADLRVLTSGPSPGWWTFFQSNGFDAQAGTPGQGGRRTATHEYVTK